MRGLSDALRMELFNSGVDVVYVAPGWVRSNICVNGEHDNLNQVRCWASELCKTLYWAGSTVQRVAECAPVAYVAAGWVRSNI